MGIRAGTSFVALGALLSAQELSRDREWIGGAPITEWTRLAGDLGGWRTDWEDAGIELSGGYVSDFGAPWSGGTRRRSAYMSLLDVNAAFDLDVLAGLPRTLAFFDFYQMSGRDLSNDVGDFQGISNIQAPNVGQIAELWIETWFDDFRIKVGKVDFNSEFAISEASGEFVNGTAAVPPTIVAYPTYPSPAMSANVFYMPSDRFYVGTAIYDGAGGDGINTGPLGPKTFFDDERSDSYFVCGEVGYAWPGGGDWGAGRVYLGAFHHTATFAKFSGGTDSGTEGIWCGFEQRLWRENPTEDDDQGISIFATVGLSDEDVSPTGSSVALGCAWNGPIDGRDDDVLAFGIWHADMSDEPGAGTPNDETVFELLYKFQLTPAISLKPEVQYITDPGGAAGVDNTLIGLLRLEVLF